MSITFFIVGAIIFVAYVSLLVWSIFYNSRKQQEENYPNLSGMGDSMDYDGMGNYGRFPSDRTIRTKRKKKNELSSRT